MTEALARQLVALTPSDLPTAQRGLAEWCQQKILNLSQELREQRENLRIAKRAKWKHSGWLTQIGRTKARMIYYTKIRQAIQAGYLIVPNLDVDVLALRVKRATPPAQPSSSQRQTSLTAGELLPPGRGRYVDDQLFTQDLSYEEKLPDGRTKKHELHRATAYDIPDLPLTLVKPQVLAATEYAMSLKLFDRIGISRNRLSDPIILGQITRPGRFHSQWSRFEGVSFFIAWWIDPEDL